ncbi:Lrp/AsnC family transcriptional regulator [Cupriavidus plantarum]|uniref:Lrp/AsnC family transcriptional regulator n=1 Tax=Cupriavidus plantarum TaxID=942865 RepID=UPI00339DA293
MDDFDHQLLALLRANARASAALLAHRLGVARTTIANRIARLEKAGVIVGYTVQGNQAREVIARLLGEPGVAALHDTNGRWDLLAEVRASSLDGLASVLERVRLIRGISATETSIHLTRYKAS